MRSSSMAVPRAGEKLPARAQACRRRRFCFEGPLSAAVAGLCADACVEIREGVRGHYRRFRGNLDGVKELVRERDHLGQLRSAAGELDDQVTMGAADRDECDAAVQVETREHPGADVDGDIHLLELIDPLLN